MARARLIEYREGGFDPRFRRWLLLLYRESIRWNSGPLLARATLDVREDPDRPGALLVAVRGDARVTHDGREVGSLPVAQAAGPSPDGRWTLSAAARASSQRRRCPSCGRGGALSAMVGGGHKCRWCALVVEGQAA